MREAIEKEIRKKLKNKVNWSGGRNYIRADLVQGLLESYKKMATFGARLDASAKEMDELMNALKFLPELLVGHIDAGGKIQSDFGVTICLSKNNEYTYECKGGCCDEILDRAGLIELLGGWGLGFNMIHNEKTNTKTLPAGSN